MTDKYTFREGIVDQINSTLFSKAAYSSKSDEVIFDEKADQYFEAFWNAFDTATDTSHIHPTIPLTEPPGHSFFTISVTKSIRYLLVLNSQKIIVAFGANNTLPVGFSK